MAIIKFVPQKKGGSLNKLSEYLTQEEKTVNKQISEYDCSKDTIKGDFQGVKELYNKTQGREYVHMVQSFKPDEVSVQEAHRVGKEMKDKIFAGHQVLLVTHEDKGHIHNHFVVNSVNMEDGHKWHQDAKKLYEIRSINDGLCNEHSLSIPEPNKNRYMDMKELRTAEKGESWKFRLMTEIDHAKNISLTKDAFIGNMKSRNYEVNWSDSRKYITYTTPDGMKCRDSKLPSEYSKEVMENEYRGSQGQEQTAGVEERESDKARENKRDSQRGSKDNNKADRDANRNSTVERNIFYSSNRADGSKREDQVSVKRNDKLIGADKEAGAVRQGREGEFKESSQGSYEQPTRTNDEGKGNSIGIESKHGGLKETEHSKVGNELEECNRADREKRKDEQGFVKSHDGDGKADRTLDRSGKENTSTNMDRERETIWNTSTDNTRDNDIGSGYSKGDSILDDIVKSLSNSIQRYEDNERDKATEREMKRILETDQKGKTKGKNRDDREWDRGRSR